MQLMRNVPFLPGVPNTVAIPTIQSEWLDNGKTLIRRQLPLTLSWSYTIHKSQVNTLYLVIIYLGKSEKCSGMTLVSISCVQKLSNFIPHPIFIEQSQSVNRSNRLPIIRNSYSELNSRFDATKQCFSRL